MFVWLYWNCKCGKVCACMHVWKCAIFTLKKCMLKTFLVWGWRGGGGGCVDVHYMSCDAVNNLTSKCQDPNAENNCHNSSIWQIVVAGICVDDWSPPVDCYHHDGESWHQNVGSCKRNGSIIFLCWLAYGNLWRFRVMHRFAPLIR